MPETSIRILRALTQVPWLKVSGEAALYYLAAHSSLDQVADGTTVTFRGRQMTHLLIPVSGVLELSMSNAQGKRHIVNRHEPGQVFGLIPVLEDSVAIHDAVARGSCEIVRVPQAALRQAMHAYPELNDQIIRVLCARARKSYQSLAAQILAALPARLAHVLLDQCSGAVSPALTMTQADLADMLGITRQSLNIELKKFERQGLISLGRGRIELMDLAQLAKLATTSD